MERVQRRRPRRLVALVALAVMASTPAVMAADVCSTVTCLANGASECDRSSASCPPCMYLLSSGSYSCYDYVDGACPYSGTTTICSSSSSSSGTSTSDASSSSSSSSTTETTTTAPSTTTATPTTTTATPTATTATPSTTSPIATVAASHVSSSSSSDSASSLRGSSSATDTSASTPTTETTSSSSSSSTSSSGSSLESSTQSSNSSRSDIIMIAVLVGCGAIAVIGIAVFIAHRLRRRQMMDRASRSTFGDALFVVPNSTGKSPAMFAVTRTYSSHHTPSDRDCGSGPSVDSMDNSFVLAADPVLTKSAVTGHTSLQSMSSLSSSTADFALGPQFRTESAVVDFTASTSSLKTHPASPGDAPDKSAVRIRLGDVPQPIVEEEEFTSFEQQSRFVRLASAESIIYKKSDHSLATAAYHQPKYAPDSSGISIKSDMSSQSDEYDIVDPGTIRDGERRNTELLVRDSEFPKFSAFSESDMMSELGDSALGKEHEI